MFGLMPGRREKKELAPREFTPMELLRREFAPLFARAFAGYPDLWEPMMEELPGVAMEEKEGELVVSVEVPGFDPKELAVTLDEEVLRIRGEHKEGKEGKEEVVRRIERAFTLPPGVEPEKIEATCRNGVLEVHVPRTPEAEPRRIEVKT